MELKTSDDRGEAAAEEKVLQGSPAVRNVGMTRALGRLAVEFVLSICMVSSFGKDKSKLYGQNLAYCVERSSIYNFVRGVHIEIFLLAAIMGSSSQDGLDKVWSIGSQVPEPIHELAHELVACTVERNHDKVAVAAWDGELTYGELDALASKLSRQLFDLGLGSDSDLVLPLCFEKSKWTAVAVLGVLKAGAGFLLLDPNVPEVRLNQIVQQVGATLILTSCANDFLSRKLSPATLIVGPNLAEGDVHGTVLKNTLQTPHISPFSTAYVVFTSGSTGIPKGCVISHQNLCSALHYQVQHLGFTPSSRVFDFAAYSFDVSIHNLFAAWSVGGCVCVPSEAERRDDLEATIARCQATIVNLTPTVARLLNPLALPHLQTLILLGEMVAERDARQWWGRARVINTYGPTECTSLTTVNLMATSPGMLRQIGVGLGAVTWIVDPQDHHALLPWGHTGELLIEGPIVGRGYLQDTARTATAFVEDPKWLLRGQPELGIPGRQARTYKTGDLARYDDNGQLVIIGRKDTQVKIRGNRVELGEVEFHVHNCIREASQVVVEAIVPAGSEADQFQLAAFLSFIEEDTTAYGVVGDGGRRSSRADSSFDVSLNQFNIRPEIESELTKHLPTYMVPSLFFVVNMLPLTPTGKTDRKILRQLGQSWNTGASRPEAAHCRPLSAAEHQLQQLFAIVLRYPTERITVDDSFLHLGGDSISAMKLTSAASRAGVKLTVADIIRYPVLSEMAKRMQKSVQGVELDQTHDHQNDLIDLVTRQSVISQASLFGADLHLRDQLDILPLTDAQEAFIRDGMSEGHQYVDYYYLDLGFKVDMPQLRTSCGRVLDAFPTLRTAFHFANNKHWMLIPTNYSVPFNIKEIEEPMDEVMAAFCLHDISTFRRHEPIVHFQVFRSKDHGSRIVVRISHAQYDAISIAVIFKALISAYKGQAIQVITSFKTYLARATHQKPQLAMYWKQLLQGYNFNGLPASFMPSKSTHQRSCRPVPFKVQSEIQCPVIPSNITMASFLSAAWAIFLAQKLGVSDILFARLVSGRNAALPSIEEVVGCCINMVPVRAHVEPGTPVSAVVNAVQDQFVAMGEADSVGFWDIFRECSDGGGDSWPPSAVSYAPDGNAAPIYTCTMHANVDESLEFEMEDGFVGRLQHFENEKRLPFFLYLVTYPRGDKLGVEIYAHSLMLSAEDARSMVDQLCPIIQSLAEKL